MTETPPTHSPVFPPEPLRSKPRRVPAEWIDYNGHMNVAYYTLAFDQALDEVFETHLGLGAGLAREARMGPMALQTQIHYLNELLEGAEFAVDFQVLDADHKRLHIFMTMTDRATGAIAATYETLSMNVDLEARRSAPYPPGPAARIEALRQAHAGLARPAQAGRSIAIRRG